MRRSDVLDVSEHESDRFDTDPTRTDSGRGGQAYNAYDFSEHPGGFSSGSAHAVAMNMAAFAIGTDTDGKGSICAPKLPLTLPQGV